MQHDRGLDAGVLIGVEVAAVGEVLGQGPGLIAGPGLEGAMSWPWLIRPFCTASRGGNAWRSCTQSAESLAAMSVHNAYLFHFMRPFHYAHSLHPCTLRQQVLI
jgi:hypothetical protein